MNPTPSDLLRRAAASAALPAIVGLSLTLAHALLSRGLAAPLVPTLSLVAALALVWALEALAPHVRAWNASARDALDDGAWMLLAALVARAYSVVVAALAPLLAVSGSLAASHPFMAATAALLIGDAAKYAMHRAAHERPSWWRFHAEHHAPASVRALNGLRLHPVNLAWNLAADLLPPLALGLDARTAAMLATFRGTVSVLQHANVRLHAGPLRYVLATPDLHRWHHAPDAHGRTNYGSTLALWDHLFGTFSDPVGAPARVGLAPGDVHPRALRDALVWPWCAARRDRCALVRGWAAR